MTELRVPFTGPEVGNWQRFLASLDVHDYEGKLIVDDEDFGARTAHGTRVFQAFRKLPETGRVDALTRKAALAEGFIPFISAKSQNIYYPKVRNINLIVIHTMESPETLSTAENVALWFSGFNKNYPAPPASAHYCVDADSVIQCVRDYDVAWHAPGANHNGLGIELAGYAKQNVKEWGDDYSTKMLVRAARLVADLCCRYAIPAVKLTPEEIRAGNKAGICGHVDITAAFPPKKGNGHWDPGPNFPWETFLAEVGGRV